MTDRISTKRRWIDRWLCSESREILELEGATPRGTEIIDELNDAYRRTGLTARLVRALILEAQRIYDMTGRPVRILEIGMRDGSLLAQLSKTAHSGRIPLDLHGVEFAPNLVALASQRLAAQGYSVQTHLTASRSLDSFHSADFDIVYSVFVLHHQSPDDLKQLLQASFRISRQTVYHFDLARSLWALALIWTFYTLFGYRASRPDAVLSCRRAYRPGEIEQIIRERGIGYGASVSRRFPVYWSIRHVREDSAP